MSKRFFISIKCNALFLFVSALLLSSCGNSTRPSSSEVDSDTIAVDTETVAERPKNMQILKDFKVLYDELIAFKDKAEFKEKGFGQGGPYYSWLQKAQNFNQREDALDLGRFGITAGDLITLGHEYNRSRGKETESTIRLNKQIKYAFEHSNDESAEDEETKSDGADTNGRNVIGRWSLTNSAFAGQSQTIEIYEKNGSYYSEEGSGPEKLKKKGNNYYKLDNPQQEYYKITSSGDLRLCDAEGDFTEEAGYTVTKLQ